MFIPEIGECMPENNIQTRVHVQVSWVFGKKASMNNLRNACVLANQAFRTFDCALIPY